MDTSAPTLWQLLFPSRTREQDPDFRSVLSDVLHTGLRQCGAIGLVGSLLYIGLSVLGLGYEVHWTYDAVGSTGLEHQVVAVGTLMIAALSVIGLVLAQMKCRLRTGRLFGVGAVLLTAMVATFEGALRGTFGTEYVIPMYLIIVAIVPFRPMQVLGIGGSVAAVVYALGPSGLAWNPPLSLTAEMTRHLVFIGGSSVLITGTSVALYRRHCAFASAQASLQKNRDLLRRVQSVAQVGGWEYDPNTDEVEGTEELFQILERPAEDTLDLDTGLSMYPEDARDAVEAALDRCLTEGNAVEMEAPLNTADDNRRWVHLRAQARERHDDTVHLIGTLQDITERHEMETRLREREQLLRSITENVNDGIYRIAPDEGLVYANKAFARIFGYESVDEVLSLGPADLGAHSNTPSPLLQVPDGDADAQEVVFERPDGSTFTGLLDGTVVRDEDGHIEYVDGVVTDITPLKERERDLQRERDRFETLFQNLPTPVVQGELVNGGARVQNVNREFEEVFGHDAASAHGQSMCDLIGPQEDPSAMAEMIQKAFHEGTLHTEVERTTPDGVRTFQLHFAARHREGRRTEGYAMFVDVTERKQREQALREREEKIEALYTATDRLLRADDEATVADRMEALVQETFDYPLNTVRLPDDDTSVPVRAPAGTRSSVKNLVDPQTDPQAQIARAYRSGETVVAEDLRDVDLSIDCGDLRSAAFLPIAGHGLMSIGSANPGGPPELDLRLLEILSTHASVVLDRIDHEQSLQRSEQRFRGIFENAGIGIALLNSDGEILESNPALQQMLRRDGDDLKEQPFEEVTHPDDVRLDTSLTETLQTEEQDSRETERLFVRANGEVFWGSLTISPHRGPGETQLIGMVEDIDDRKRQKQKLKQAKEKAEEMSRLKSAFLANMSHEIRTPLTSILGFAEAIENAEETDEEIPVGKFARRITKSGNRLLETLDSVLDLSQLEAGAMELSLDRVDLTQAVQETADHLKRKAETTGVTLQAEAPDSPVRITADQDALRRIQRSLLSNALKYTEEGGQAWIRVREENDAAVLEVEDTGIGMEPEQVDKLFDAFEQASTGTNRLHEGSGLGLALVDRLVDRMGGSIDVETEKGVGTCFTVRFPKDDSAAGESAE